MDDSKIMELFFERAEQAIIELNIRKKRGFSYVVFKKLRVDPLSFFKKMCYNILLVMLSSSSPRIRVS